MCFESYASPIAYTGVSDHVKRKLSSSKSPSHGKSEGSGREHGRAGLRLSY